MVLPLTVRAKLEVIAIKRYSTLLRAPELKPLYQMQFVDITS